MALVNLLATPLI